MYLVQITKAITYPRRNALKLNDETRMMLMTHAESSGVLPGDTDAFARQVGQMLQLIVSTQEYQFT